jgi:large subunit ribosomal protein L7Ae
MSYQQFEPSDSLAEKTYDTIEKAEDTGQVQIGTNEATKAIERNDAELIVIAGNVSPAEVVMHLPSLAEERDIPYTFVPDKEELGLAAGINVQSAAIAITDAGTAEDNIQDIQQKAEELIEKEEEE